MNGSYSIISSLDISEGGLQLDPHDFEIIKDGSRIIQAISVDRSLPRSSDHTAVLSLAHTIVKEAGFQVAKLDTGLVEFEWRSLDHVPVNESCLGSGHPDYL